MTTKEARKNFQADEKQLYQRYLQYTLIQIEMQAVSKKIIKNRNSFKPLLQLFLFLVLTCIVLFHDPCDVPVLFPTFDGFTLVIIMFPFSEP